MTGPPFRSQLVDGIHDITRAMYGDSRLADTSGRAVGATTFSDALRASIDGRTVIVANANTYIDPGLFQAGHFSPDVAVCAVELGTFVPGIIVQPERIQQISTGAEPGPATRPSTTDSGSTPATPVSPARSSPPTSSSAS